VKFSTRRLRGGGIAPAAQKTRSWTSLMQQISYSKCPEMRPELSDRGFKSAGKLWILKQNICGVLELYEWDVAAHYVEVFGLRLCMK
jgi:hypothetical protein